MNNSKLNQEKYKLTANLLSDNLLWNTQESLQNHPEEFFAALADYLRDSWIWGAPEGLSNQPEQFRTFLDTTEGFTYIPATRVTRIGEIDEEKAEAFLDFLRYPPKVLRSKSYRTSASPWS